MTITFINIKTKIALHSLGRAILLLIALLLAIILKLPLAIYCALGILIAEMLSVIFSKRKYLISVYENDSVITINYLNRLLQDKNVTISKEGLELFDIKEANWWYGLDRINFTNAKQNLTFNAIDRKSKQSIVENLCV